MENHKVVAICWMLVAITIVCIFAAKVSIERDRLNYSYVVNPPAPHAQRNLFAK